MGLDREQAATKALVKLGQRSLSLEPPGAAHVAAPDKSYVSLEGLEVLAVKGPGAMLALFATSVFLGGALALMLLVALVGPEKIPPWVTRVPWWTWLLPCSPFAIVWARLQYSEGKNFEREQHTWVALIEERANKEIEAHKNLLIKKLEAQVLEQSAQWTHEAINEATLIILDNAQLQNDGTGFVFVSDWLISCQAPVKCEITITGGIVTIYRHENARLVRHLLTITKLQTDIFDGETIPGKPRLSRRGTALRLPVGEKLTGTYHIAVRIEYTIEHNGEVFKAEMQLPERLIDVA